MGSRKRHLLVVDDDTLSARIVEQTLKAKGYTVSTASNGSAALYILAHNATVDMVVADHHAPSCDGFALLKAIKDTRRSMPVVIVSDDPAVAESVNQWDNLAVQHKLEDLHDNAAQVLGAVVSMMPAARPSL